MLLPPLKPQLPLLLILKLDPLNLVLPLLSPVLAIRAVNSKELRTLMVPPLRLRRPLSMLPSRLLMTMSPRHTSSTERKETWPPPPLPRQLPMLT